MKDIQSKPQEEENIFASGPAVFKGAKRIIFEGTIVSQGAFSAVGGSMYIGCTPGEPFSDVHRQEIVNDNVL